MWPQTGAWAGIGKSLSQSGTLGEKQYCAAGDLGTASLRHSRGPRKFVVFVGKLLVTGGCFSYVTRQIDFGEVWSAISTLDFRWAGLALLVNMLQIPLLGLRWRDVVQALVSRHDFVTRAGMIAATAIGLFVAQVLPNVAGEGVRAWLLVRLGCDWRNAITSVLIDRAVGVGLLIALGFGVLLLPSGLSALGGYGDMVLVTYGALLLGGAVGLVLGPRIISPLADWRYFRWPLNLVADARRVILGRQAPIVLALGCVIHAMTVVMVWALGHAQGLALPISDAAVLVTIMIGVTLVPVSISGWGLRELAVISLLGNYGLEPGKALLFSVCFGLTTAIGSLPGALTWLVYSFTPAPRLRQSRPPRGPGQQLSFRAAQPHAGPQRGMLF